MVVRLGQELYTPGVQQSLKRIQRLRAVFFELLKKHAREREADFEFGIRLQQLEHQRIRRKVCLACHFLDDLFIVELSVGSIVEVQGVAPDIEYPIALEAPGLVN